MNYSKYTLSDMKSERESINCGCRAWLNVFPYSGATHPPTVHAMLVLIYCWIHSNHGVPRGQSLSNVIMLIFGMAWREHPEVPMHTLLHEAISTDALAEQLHKHLIWEFQTVSQESHTTSTSLCVVLDVMLTHSPRFRHVFGRRGVPNLVRLLLRTVQYQMCSTDIREGSRSLDMELSWILRAIGYVSEIKAVLYLCL